MKALSPGVVNSCLELLSLVSRRVLTFGQVRASFSHIGVTPTPTVVETVQRLGWAQINDEGQIVLTATGSRLLSTQGYQERLRQAILDYVDVEQPFWAQDALYGRKRVVSFAGMPIAQLFLEAGLVDGICDDVVEFWDTLAARARGLRDDRLLAVGRIGERMTLAFELSRTGRKPKWIAIDNAADGYDVLSVLNSTDSSPLSIEVKSTLAGPSGMFHLTRNEWDRAQMAPAHLFHLWDLSAKPPRLSVLSPVDIQPHVPQNSGQGEWERAEIPFSAYLDRLQPITSVTPF